MSGIMPFSIFSQHMLFARNAQDPIYNSLSDLKSHTPINEWFNLSVYDESTLSQIAQEIESIIKKIPESFLSQLPLHFKNFQSSYKQRTFNDIDDDAWFRQFFHSPKQLEKHYPLAILAFPFDFAQDMLWLLFPELHPWGKPQCVCFSYDIQKVFWRKDFFLLSCYLQVQDALVETS